MIFHHGSFGKWVAVNSDGVLSFDPIIEMPKNMRKQRNVRSLFHVAVTATDAPYNKWQCRIMYYGYKKQKNLPGSEMGAFTRILHSGNPDNLMDEIPTVVVDPLPAGMDRVWLCCSICYAWRAAFSSGRLHTTAPEGLGNWKKGLSHYTYGCDYNLKGELTYGQIGEWRFAKRSFVRVRCTSTKKPLLAPSRCP